MLMIVLTFIDCWQGQGWGDFRAVSTHFLVKVARSTAWASCMLSGLCFCLETEAYRGFLSVFVSQSGHRSGWHLLWQTFQSTFSLAYILKVWLKKVVHHHRSLLNSLPFLQGTWVTSPACRLIHTGLSSSSRDVQSPNFVKSESGSSLSLE